MHNKAKLVPEGYTLTKGKCVGPTIQTETQVCPDEGPNGDRVDLFIVNGEEYCVIGIVASVFRCPPGTEPIFTTGQCINPTTNEIVDIERTCHDPPNQILHPETDEFCYVIIPMVTETTTSCSVEGAILNTEANTCTIKPGRAATA